MNVPCNNCGKEVWRSPSRLKKFRNTFCSKGCHNKYMYKEVSIKCDHCGIGFNKNLAKYLKAKSHFCSARCQHRFIRGVNHQNYNTVVIKCSQCRKDVARCPSLLRDNVFCDQKCYGDWVSENNRGENHPNWTGGTDESRRLRGTKEWADWRREVYERDDYTCQLCFLKGLELQPHHVRRRVDYPELTFDVGNGVTLCKECHYKTINKEHLYIEYFDNIMSVCNLFKNITME